MDEVYVHLGRAIYRWSGFPPGSYGLGRPLWKLWVGPHGVGIPYYWHGVQRLLNLMYQDPFFLHYPRPPLVYTFFAPDVGGIQTVGQLYNYFHP
jgi:hypothetical protein